jgi:3-hydroxyisobutyrate dehydrogenase-like beta-hydroxyacid dehydrogenase
MERVAFLGTGLLGGAMVERLARRLPLRPATPSQEPIASISRSPTTPWSTRF